MQQNAQMRIQTASATFGLVEPRSASNQGTRWWNLFKTARLWLGTHLSAREALQLVGRQACGRATVLCLLTATLLTDTVQPASGESLTSQIICVSRAHLRHCQVSVLVGTLVCK